MAIDDYRLLKIDQVLRVCAISRSTLYALIARDEFPKPVRVGVRAVAWRQGDVLEWKARDIRGGRLAIRHKPRRSHANHARPVGTGPSGRRKGDVAYRRVRTVGNLSESHPEKIAAVPAGLEHGTGTTPSDGVRDRGRGMAFRETRPRRTDAGRRLPRRAEKATPRGGVSLERDGARVKVDHLKDAPLWSKAHYERMQYLLVESIDLEL